jgi:alpha-beta hydrolase superfamily lysophospholipase
MGVHLLAVSWGGKLAIALAKAHADAFASLALVAPGIFPLEDAPLLTKLRVVTALITGRQRRLLPIPLADASLFTANPERIRYIESDQLGLRRVTARFMLESRRLDRYIRDAPGHIRIPTFLALAGKDRIINNPATERYVSAFRSAVKQIKTYPEAHHTLEFELNPEAFFDDLVAWVRERAEPSQIDTPDTEVRTT